MSVPALRQPKFVTHPHETKKKHHLPDVQYVIVTLKDENKLVVSSDAYHGVITIGDMYKCVFCQIEMELDTSFKEAHKKSNDHVKMLEKYPHAEQYAGNLIRQLKGGSSFCTICNVSISNSNLTRHLQTDVHIQELEKAGMRANIYKPY